ncbi:MAG TPA: M1 family aminopeptidase [Thermoanaerobaculales bacterium]|nr:M1 family aminopeptidase [Thermoanaerobaculales bacterium]HQL29003.1 M1 family aminopeptidase [Thermoanaerobaculales bacterium]
MRTSIRVGTREEAAGGQPPGSESHLVRETVEEPTGRCRRVPAAVAAAIVISAAASFVHAETLAVMAEALNRPTVGAAVSAPNGIRFGRAELTLDPGATVLALEADGRRCGVLLQGALLRYRVDDPLSLPVASRNFKSTIGFAAEPDGPFTFEVAVDAAVWSWSLGSFDAAPGPASGASLPGWVTEVLDRPGFSAPAVEMLDALHNGRPEVFYAVMKAPGETLLAVYDPAEAKEESLYSVGVVKGAGLLDRGRHFLYELVTQPVGRSWLERPPGCLVAIRRSIDVDNDTGQHVTVRSRTRLQATRAARLWRAELASRRVRDNHEYPITVRSVSVAGKPADYLRADNELLVMLPTPLQANGTVEVEVVNEGEMALRFEGDAYWVLGMWGWYPQGDLGAELPTLELSVRVPSALEVFASGDTVSRTTEGAMTVLRTAFDHPIQNPVIVAGDYTVVSETRNGITCRVANYGGAKKDAAQRLVNNFFSASQFYGELFGVPYPFKEVTIVELNSWGYGQAPPGVIFLTKEAFDQIGSDEARAYSYAINDRFVHEVAHAWWGHVVKMNSFDEQWLEESIADYSSAVFLVFARGAGKKADRELAEITKDWRSSAAVIGEGATVFMANHLAGKADVDDEERYALLYAKGPLVLHSLRTELRRTLGSDDRGDEAFFTVLRTLLASFPYRWGETRHLLGILNQVTGQDWRPWFDRYVFGTEMPILAAGK